jgi:hypothetical protein
MMSEVAHRYRVRAEKALRQDDAETAWKDLLAAESLNTSDPELTKLRTVLTKLGLAECRAGVLTGHPLRVLEALARLKQRTAYHPDFAWYEDAAREWVIAHEQADRGDFSAALVSLDRGRAKVPTDLHSGFDECREEFTRRQATCGSAVSELYAAAEANRWADVLRHADTVMATAPDHREARNLKARAWQVIQSGIITPSQVVPAPSEEVVELAWAMAGGATASTKTHPGRIHSVSTPSDGSPRPSSPGTPAEMDSPVVPKRFILWIDGVGGYLVCLGARVGFGQATGSGPVDVPLFADVSRLHAELTRDTEGYVLESGREVMVNGQAVRRSVLTSGDRVTLGSTCQFVFHQPVPISPSARLELVSGHRLPLAVDGILLMAENLILGPHPPVHVPMPESSGNVILYRSKDGLGIRFGGPFKIDNQPFRDRTTLPVPCSVTSESFSFAIEVVSQWF